MPKSNGSLKLVSLTLCVLLAAIRLGFGQLGETLNQCEQKYGPVLQKDRQGWHTFKKEPYYVLVHFYEGKADAVQYVNWINSPKAFSENEIADLLKQNSPNHWEVADAGAESTMYTTKGFTGVHLKLDHILMVAADGYLERGISAQAHQETARLKGS
jgi:hypothetical protein